MIKKKATKVTLHRETLHILEGHELQAAGGAKVTVIPSCLNSCGSLCAFTC